MIERAKRGRPRSSVPASRRNSARDTLILAAFRAGSTLEAIGREHGIARERVRQIVNKALPADVRKAVRVGRRQARQAQRQAERLRPYLDRPVPCTMCHAIVLRSTPWKRKYPTCSHQCHQAFVAAKWYVSPDEVRQAIARMTLRTPEKYSDVQVRYAARVLAGEAGRRGPNRHPKESRARQVAREFGFLPAEEKVVDTEIR